MSYTREIGNTTVTAVCAANPEANYAQYYSDIEKKISIEYFKKFMDAFGYDVTVTERK